MTINLKYFIPAFLGLAALTLVATVAYGEVNFSEQTQTSNYQNFNFFPGPGNVANNATTTTATSTNLTGGGGYFKIAGAKNVVLYFSRGDTTGQGNAGSSQFRIQVTPDGTNWYDYNHLASSSPFGQVSILPLVGTTTLSTGTSTQMYRMHDLGFYGVRCIVIETTDGEHSCKASAEF